MFYSKKCFRNDKTKQKLQSMTDNWSSEKGRDGCEDLFVDPFLRAALVGHQLLRLEPQADLFICAVHGVAAMDDVPENTITRLLSS